MNKQNPPVGMNRTITAATTTPGRKMVRAILGHPPWGGKEGRENADLAEVSSLKGPLVLTAFDHGSPTGSRKLLLVELKRAWNILLSLLSHVGIAADMTGKTAALPRRLIQWNYNYAAAAVAACISVEAASTAE